MEQQNLYELKNLNGKKEKLNDKRFDEDTPKEQNYLNAKLSNNGLELSASMANINWDYTKELKKYSDFLSISLLNDLEYIETFRKNDYQAHESFNRISCLQSTFPEVIRNSREAETVCPEQNAFFVKANSREKEVCRNDNEKIMIDQEESAIDCEYSFQNVEHVNNSDSKTSIQHKAYIDLTQISTDNSSSSTSTSSNANFIEKMPPKCRNIDYDCCVTNKYQVYENIPSNSYPIGSNILYHDKNNQSPTLNLKKRFTNTENSLKSENHINKIHKGDMGINGASSLFSIRDLQKRNLDSKNFLKYNSKPENVLVERHLNNYQQKPICLRTPHHEYNVFNTKNECSHIDAHNHNRIGVYNTRESCFCMKLSHPYQTTKPPPVSSSTLTNIRSPYFLSPNYSDFRFC